jgi:GR25 family glycosyltransferase involved in LPS biosynthesis
MNLNECFPNKVCINLDRRTDRWQKMLARFAQHDIQQVDRFAALDGKSLAIPAEWAHLPGAYGCLRSHLSVIELARTEARQSVLIFEDDAVFDPQFNARFAACINQVPGDWDMLLFGGLHGEPPHRVSNNVTRVTHSLSTYAYAMKHTIYDGFIEINRQAAQLLDQNTRLLQKRFNCYCFMPHLAWVEEDYSDVTEERSNLWWLRESLVLFGKDVDQILNKSVVIISYCPRGEAAFKNLNFTVDYCRRKLPKVALLIVEQGEEPTLALDELPAQCQLEFLRASGSGQRNQAFNLGFEMFEDSKDFFLFMDSDVFLTREDILGNLIKCAECDFATSFSEISYLNEPDSLRILNDDVRWDYQSSNYQERRSICQFSCFFTKRGMRIIGGWDKANDQAATVTSRKVRQLLSIYESPNAARLLFS